MTTTTDTAEAPPAATARTGRKIPPYRTRKTKGRRISVGTIAIGVILFAGAVITAFPLIWMLSTSVKTRRESVAFPPHIAPDAPTFEFFSKLFTELNFGVYLTNTVIIVLIGYVGLMIMSMAGYAFAKFDFRGKRSLFFLVLATLMIPVQVTMIPTYLLINSVHLGNSLLGMALPTLVSGFGIFLFRQFMATIPTEVLEAARIDGAGEVRIFFLVVLPMSKPIFAVQIVLTFIAGWNSFLWPLILASDQKLYTLSLGLALLNKQLTVNPPLQMAAASVMVVPILLVFIIFQKYVIQGFALSGLK